LEIDECEPESDSLPEILNYESDDESCDINVESSQSSSLPSSRIRKSKTFVSLEDKKKAVDYLKSGKKKKLSLATVSKRYRFVTSTQQLYSFEKQIEQSGSRVDKLKEIWLYTVQQFKEAKNKSLIVHDNDLRRWAIKRKLKLNSVILMHRIFGFGNLKIIIESFHDKSHDLLPLINQEIKKVSFGQLNRSTHQKYSSKIMMTIIYTTLINRVLIKKFILIVLSSLEVQNL
jgi:hypothetical protein